MRDDETKVLSVRMTWGLARAIDVAAYKRGCSMSTLMREVLEAAFNEEEAEDPLVQRVRSVKGWLDGRTTEEIIEEMHVERSWSPRKDQTRMAAALRAAGMRASRKRMADGTRLRVWVLDGRNGP